MKVSDHFFDLLEEEEGWRASPYLCPAKVWTIGYGSTLWEDGKPVKSTDKPIDKERGKAVVEAHLMKSVYPSMKKIKVELNQNQIDAIASFIYNIGGKAFESSSMFKRINESNFSAAALEFDKWTRGGGKVLPGLVRRRKKEKELFLKG